MIFCIVVLVICAIRIGFKLNSTKAEDSIFIWVDVILAVYALCVLFFNFYKPVAA